MTKVFKQYKVEIIVLVLIAAVYFLLRLPNLTVQPIFVDEAIYVRWAQVMRAEPTLRFLPLSDGKTPLFMWAMIPLFKVFEDPLYAGRFLSVLSGALTVLGGLFLGWKFFSLRVGLWAALLITVTPYIVFFDRMALVDSMLSAFSIWSLNLSLMLIKYQRIDIAMALGYTLGAGWITKTPGMFNLLVLPTSLIVANFKVKNRQWNLLKIFGLLIISVVIALTIYNLLRLGPGFSGLSSRNQDYIFSLEELKGRILDPFIPHLGDIRDWFPKLLGIPTLALMICGVFFAFFKRNRYAIVVLLWAIIPLLIQMAFLKTFTARYVLFSIPPLLFLAGWAIFLFSQKFKLKGAFVLLFVVLGFSLSYNWNLLNDVSKANLPKSERRGYLEDWTAGYGLKDIAQFLMEKAEGGTIVVGTEGFFGTLPDGLQIYLDKYLHTAIKEKQIMVVGSSATVSAELREAALRYPTYFVANKSRVDKAIIGAELIKEYPKAKSNSRPQDAMLLFRVLPPDIK